MDWIGLNVLLLAVRAIQCERQLRLPDVMRSDAPFDQRERESSQAGGIQRAVALSRWLPFLVARFSSALILVFKGNKSPSQAKRASLTKEAW